MSILNNFFVYFEITAVEKLNKKCKREKLNATFEAPIMFFLWVCSDHHRQSSHSHGAHRFDYFVPGTSRYPLSES